MLHVLDLYALGAPDEERVGVRGIDNVGDLETEIVRLANVLLRGIDEDGEVVQERPLGLLDVALVELHERAASFDAGCAILAASAGRKPRSW